MARAGLNARANMATRSTRERRNRNKPLGRGARMSQDFRTLVRRKRGARTRRNSRVSTSDNGG